VKFWVFSKRLKWLIAIEEFGSLSLQYPVSFRRQGHDVVYFKDVINSRKLMQYSNLATTDG